MITDVEGEVTDEEVNGQSRILALELRGIEDGEVVETKTERVQVPFHSTADDIQLMMKSRCEERMLDHHIKERQDEFQEARDDPVGMKVSDDDIAHDMCEEILECQKNNEPTSLERAKQRAREKKKDKQGGEQQ